MVETEKGDAVGSGGGRRGICRFGDLDLAAVEWPSPVRRWEKLVLMLWPEVSGVDFAGDLTRALRRWP